MVGQLHKTSHALSGARRALGSMPLDGLTRLWKRDACYTLGVATIAPSESMLGRCSRDLALRCAERSGKRTLFLEPPRRNARRADQDALSVAGSDFNERTWDCLSDALDARGTDFRRAMAELAEFSRLKHEYELIVVSLGDIASQSIARVGKLCDGIVLLFEPSPGGLLDWRRQMRVATPQIRSHQAEGLNFVGIWHANVSVATNAPCMP